MKIIFMGTPTYAQKILEELISADDLNVVAVYTQPDKPVGRKKIITPSAVKVTAKEANINLYQPTTLKSRDVIDELLGIECDLIIVAAYGQILPKEILQHAPCINLHASILPKYRGASPIQEALLNGDKETGITAMKMDEGLDTGDIIKISRVSIGDDEMAKSLLDRLTEAAAALTLDVVRNYDTYKSQKQNDSQASYCSKISRSDGEVQFDNASKLYNRYRAFTPWPGVFLSSGLKLKEIKLHRSQGQYKSGEIIEINDKSIVVGCTTGAVEIYTVQPVSKKEMPVLSYINGKRLQIADHLS